MKTIVKILGSLAYWVATECADWIFGLQAIAFFLLCCYLAFKYSFFSLILTAPCFVMIEFYIFTHAIEIRQKLKSKWL